MTQAQHAERSVGTASPEYDAIIVGAGFGGLRAIHSLRDRLGLSVKVLDNGPEVGGTWFWNRYPGARTDTEAWSYCMYFDEDLYKEWAWSEKFPTRDEMRRYLNFVADRHDMKRSIEFNRTVETAEWDEDDRLWRVTTDDGGVYTATYFVPASGFVGTPMALPFPGLDRFRGEWYMSARWPEEPVDYVGKRVAVVGTGATGVQLVPTVSRTADHLTVFQRTPNYVLPARNFTIDPDWSAELRESRQKFYDLCSNQTWGFPLENSEDFFENCSADEIHRILDRAWETGGFGFVFTGLGDAFYNDDAARVTQQFVHEKIRSIVHDERTAALLTPTDHRLGAKRPPMGHDYYQAFNRDNVSLVSVKDNPISEITESGIKLADGDEYEFDIIIFALGFEAVTGSLCAMDIRGRNGASLRERWKSTPASLLGICVDDFPNLLMPHGPLSVGGNVPLVLDISISWIENAIRYMRENGIETIEADPAALDEYRRASAEVVKPTVLWQDGQSTSSWFTRTNVEGAEPSAIFYFGGVGPWVEKLKEEEAHAYKSFVLRGAQ